jgi:hypothetical protein
MRSGRIRMSRGLRWLRGHVEVFPVPGDRTQAVTARTPTPEIEISLRRVPAASRVTIEEVRR